MRTDSGFPTFCKLPQFTDVTMLFRLRFDLTLLILGLCFILGACAKAPSPVPANDGSMLLEENGDGTFSITYTFTQPHLALVFGQAPLSYRAGIWTSETPEASVQAIGDMDVLVFEAPATEARFRFAPSTQDFRKAYTAFLPFTGGDWAVLTGQFRLKPANSLDALAAHDGSAEAWPTEDLELTLSIRSDRPIWLAGAEYEGDVQTLPESDDTYAYIGALEPLSATSFVGFVDPSLPAWIQDGFDTALLDIFATLSAGWGFELPEKSTLFFSFRGLERDGLHLTGGALDGGVLALEVGGNALESPSPEIATYLEWFFAHEAAHLYQTAGGIEPDDPDHAWIHEGSANTMAHAVAASRSDDPATFLNDVYGRAFDDCTGFLATGPLTEAASRGAFDAYYACGDFMALMTDAALPDLSLYTFWNRLKADALATEEGQITATLYFETLTALGASEDRVNDIKMIDSGTFSEPRAQFLDLLHAAGLEVGLDESGNPERFRLYALHDRTALARP